MASGISAAMVAELAGLGRVFPTFDLTLAGVTHKFAAESIASASAGMYLPYVTSGGWGEITRSVTGRNVSLQTPNMSVSVFDEKRAIQKALGGPASGEVYGAAADVYLRSNYVDSADHYQLINGVIRNYEMPESRVWSWTLEPDLQSMNSANRMPVINNIDFPNAPASSLGEDTWCVYGNHVSQGFTDAVGMVPAVCVDEVNYWWLASVGNVAEVPKVWRNGTVETNWTLDYKLINGQWFSIITDTDATAVPADDITFDCFGVETDGDGSSGTVITAPIPILENYLSNWVFNRYPDDSADGSTWVPRTSAPINTTHFDETAAFLDDRNHTAATVIYKSETGLEVLNKLCADFDVFPFWSWDWTLGVRPKNPSNMAIYDGTILAQRDGDFLGGCTKLAANPDQQISEIEVVYDFNETEGDGMNRNLVKDPGALLVRAESVDFEYGKSSL